MQEHLQKHNNKICFLILWMLTLVTAYTTNRLLNVEELLYIKLSKEIATNQVSKLIEFQTRWQWISYVSYGIILLIKISLITITLYLGGYLLNTKFIFKRVWNSVVKSEYVFLLMALSKLIWFYFFETDFTFEDVQYFTPLSALSITGYEGIAPWFIYPLQTINLFELFYWFVLAYFLGNELKISMDKGFRIVAIGYGSGLMFWMVTIMFLVLNFN